MKHRHHFAAITIAAGLALSCFTAHADDEPILTKIDQQLDELKTYDYDRSGNALQAMEQTIFQLPADSPLRGPIEQKLIDALDDANSIGRGVICQQLRVIGTDKCVPAVASMLDDPDLSQRARYALQGIGSTAALKAMHNALGETSGTLQIGLLNSLAERSYEPMRSDCVKLLGAGAPDVAAAAARALGRLGGRKSVDALTHARTKASQELGLDINMALLNCAAKLLDDGEAEAAAKIYNSLYQPESPFRIAGLRGLVLAQPNRATDLLVSAMEQGDDQLTMAAINLTTQVEGSGATKEFVSLFDNLPRNAQVVMLKVLGKRGDHEAAPVVAAAASSNDTEIRLAALDALGGLGGNEALEVLLTAAGTGDQASQRVARASLARIDGAATQLLDIASSSKVDLAVEAIRALAQRDAHDAVPMMTELAKDQQLEKHTAAINALGLLAREDELGLLIQLALTPKSPQDLPFIEKSLSRVLTKVTDAADRATPLLSALPVASANVRPVLVRQLSKSGTKEALGAVRAALESNEPATSDAAVTALANWPNETAADDLIKLIKSAKTPKLQSTALSGYLRIASASQDPTQMFLEVLNNVQGTTGKKLVLNEIGLNCESLAALDMTQSLYEDPQLKATAAIATIRLAYKLRNSHEDRARESLVNVLAQVDHPDVQKRAQEVLNDIDKYEGYIKQWVAVGPYVDEEIVSGRQSFDMAFAPEKANANKPNWKPLTLGVGSWSINLESTYGSLDHCTAYVKTMVWSPVDQPVQIEAGSDDALRIWVNDELVFNQYTERGAAPRQSLAPAKLRQGWNELKLKVVDHEGGWVFACRIRQPNGAKLEGLKYEAR